MKEYVDIEVLKQQDFQDFSNIDVMYAIDHCPRVDVEPVRHGHWIPIRKRMYACNDPVGEICTVGYTCSECEHEEDYEAPYCNCGAKMDGKEKE